MDPARIVESDPPESWSVNDSSGAHRVDGASEHGIGSGEHSHEGGRHSRFTSRQKTEAVLRLLKGESAENVSRELGVTIGRIERWKDRFVAAGSAELARRQDHKQGWAAKHSQAFRQWLWLLLTLIGTVTVLVLLMQRGSQE